MQIGWRGLGSRNSVRPSVTHVLYCFVTNPKNLPAIFLYHILSTANMQLKMRFRSSHQLKSYVAPKSRLKFAARCPVSSWWPSCSHIHTSFIQGRYTLLHFIPLHTTCCDVLLCNIPFLQPWVQFINCTHGCKKGILQSKTAQHLVCSGMKCNRVYLPWMNDVSICTLDFLSLTIFWRPSSSSSFTSFCFCRSCMTHGTNNNSTTTNCTLKSNCTLKMTLLTTSMQCRSSYFQQQATVTGMEEPVQREQIPIPSEYNGGWRRPGDTLGVSDLCFLQCLTLLAGWREKHIQPTKTPTPLIPKDSIAKQVGKKTRPRGEQLTLVHLQNGY